MLSPPSCYGLNVELHSCGIGHMNSCLIMHFYVLYVCMLVRMHVGLDTGKKVLCQRSASI